MPPVRANDCPLLSATDAGLCPRAPVDGTGLDQLPTGAHATVLCVNCPAHMRKRLAEMGILPGVTVQMKRTAPMGDPIAFQVRGYQLSLRRSDAGLIRVREISDSPLHVAPLAEHTAPTTILPAGNDQP